MAKDEQTFTPDSSAGYYYNCEHGSSNDQPCPVHFPGWPPQPDNWMSHAPSEPGGIEDATNVG